MIDIEQVHIDRATLNRERLYVVILAAIQIVHILDFVIIMPLGPQFMRMFQITPSEFSALVSTYTFSAGVFGFFAALYADHFDRKKFLQFNFMGFIIGTFMCSLANNFSTLLLARIVAGAFGGVLNSCVLSLVSDLIPVQRRGTAMGVVMSAFSISSVIGVPLGLYIANAFGWHSAFYFICLVAIIFWFMAMTILPSVKIRTEAMSVKENLKNFKNILTQPDYLLSFSLTSFLGFGVFMIVPFISPYMVRNVGMAESDIPLIYLTGGICTIISARIVGKACDKIGSFKVFRFSTMVSLIPILLLTHLPEVPLYIALFSTSAFMMIGSGRFIPAMTLVSAVVKPAERGTFMSLENAARQFSSGASSQLAGFIIGSTTAGALTNYHIIGYFGITTTLISLGAAYKIKTKFKLR